MRAGYVPGDGPLRRAHPFTPLTNAAVLAVLVFVAPPPFGPPAILATAIALAMIGGVPRVLRTAALTVLPFAGFAFLIRGVIGGEPALALSLTLRITTVLVAGLTTLAVVQPARLVDALIERRFPFSLAYVFAATLQAVPRFRDRGRQILEAQRCRGLSLQGPPWKRARALAPLAIPLIMGALAEVDERTFALESRGAAHVVQRTPLNPIPDTAAQRGLRWGLLGLLLVAIIIRVAR